MNLRQGIDAMLRHKERLDSPRDAVKTHLVKYRGKTFKCTIGEEQRSEQLLPGGFISQVSLRIIIRKSEIDPDIDASLTSLTADNTDVTADDDSTQPRPNFDITIVDRNRDYRIQRVTLNSVESHFSLDCVDAKTP